jgi:hypothetical protein
MFSFKEQQLKTRFLGAVMMEKILDLEEDEEE